MLGGLHERGGSAVEERRAQDRPRPRAQARIAGLARRAADGSVARKGGSRVEELDRLVETGSGAVGRTGSGRCSSVRAAGAGREPGLVADDARPFAAGVEALGGLFAEQARARGADASLVPAPVPRRTDPRDRIEASVAWAPPTSRCRCWRRSDDRGACYAHPAERLGSPWHSNRFGFVGRLEALGDLNRGSSYYFACDLLVNPASRLPQMAGRSSRCDPRVTRDYGCANRR